MKSFKPKDSNATYGYIPENTNELFLDVKLLRIYKKAVKSTWGKQSHDRLTPRLGKTVFVFDIDSCEFFEREE